MIGRLFQLQPGEVRLFLMLAALLFGNSLARQVSDVVAVSGFLSHVGANLILVVWLIDMSLIVLVTGLQSLIVDRFQRITLLRWMTLGFALIFMLLLLMFGLNMPAWLTYGLLYLLAEQQLLFFPVIFWILANDAISMAQAKRLFPLVAGVGIMGQIAGLGLAALAPTLQGALGLAPQSLLVVNVVSYALLFLVIQRLIQVRIRHTNYRPVKIRESLLEGRDFVRSVPAFRYLMLSVLAVNVCLTIAEFRFLVVSGQTFTEMVDYQRFYSLYRLGLTLAMFAALSLLSSRVGTLLSLKNTFFALPAALFGGSLLMLLAPGMIGTIAGFSLGKFVQLTLDEPARKSLQSLVPEERRGRVGMFIDSHLFAVGTIIGALITGLVIVLGTAAGIENYFWIYLSVSVLVASVALWSISRMRSVYDSSLLHWRLKRRQRATNILEKFDL
jgi:ATP:ADP antiporter, AAA family